MNKYDVLQLYFNAIIFFYNLFSSAIDVKRAEAGSTISPDCSKQKENCNIFSYLYQLLIL